MTAHYNTSRTSANAPVLYSKKKKKKMMKWWGGGASVLTYYEIFHIKFGHDKYGYYEWADVGSDELISIDSKKIYAVKNRAVCAKTKSSLVVNWPGNDINRAST